MSSLLFAIVSASEDLDIPVNEIDKHVEFTNKILQYLIEKKIIVVVEYE